MEWNIQSRSHACTACGTAFVDKQHYHTLLFDERAEFKRSDLCQGCWDRQYSDGARDRRGFISYWQGVYEAPAPVAEPIQKETAETLLRKLIEFNDPRYLPAGYILAVMLERKRVLKVKEQIIRDGQRVFVYEQPRTGDLFTIADPNLQLDQLESVQQDVANLMEHGLPAAAPAPDPNSAAPAAVVAETGATGLAQGATPAEDRAESAAPASAPVPAAKATC